MPRAAVPRVLLLLLPYYCPAAPSPLLPLPRLLLSGRKRLLLEIYSFNNVKQNALHVAAICLPCMCVSYRPVCVCVCVSVCESLSVCVCELPCLCSCVFSIYASITSSFVSLHVPRALPPSPPPCTASPRPAYRTLEQATPRKRSHRPATAAAATS